MKRIKWDGHYVKECDYEYLVECDKQESLFEDEQAESMKKQCPHRVEIEHIMPEIEEANDLVSEFEDTMHMIMWGYKK